MEPRNQIARHVAGRELSRSHREGGYRWRYMRATLTSQCRPMASVGTHGLLEQLDSWPLAPETTPTVKTDERRDESTKAEQDVGPRRVTVELLGLARSSFDDRRASVRLLGLRSGGSNQVSGSQFAATSTKVLGKCDYLVDHSGPIQ